MIQIAPLVSRIQPQTESPNRQVRRCFLALIIDYSSDEQFEALRDRFKQSFHRPEVFVSGERSVPGTPRSTVRSMKGENGAIEVAFQLRREKYEYAVFVRDPLIGPAEIDEVVAQLTEKNKSIHFLIPGLNDLLTAGFAAVVGYDLKQIDDSLFRSTPLGLRLRQALAPKLPKLLKRWIKLIMHWFGLLPWFGFPRVVPAGAHSSSTEKVSSEPVRISSHKSVAWVLDQQNFGNVNYGYSLGNRSLQKRFFVDQVAIHFPYPRTVSLVLSNQCNLKCVMCPYHSPQFVQLRQNDYFDRESWMPLSLVMRLAEELKDINQEITFHMGELDEPTMHPDLSEIVRILSQVPRSTVHITTNGLLMKEKLARSVIDGGLKSISFSVDANTPETYKAIRGGKLEVVRTNVERFLQLRDELNPDLYVNLCIINQPAAAAEIEDFKLYWRERGASSVSVYQLFVPEKDNPAQWVVPNKFFGEKERTPCTAAWDQCFLYPEGEVSLCCTTLVRVPQDGVISVGNLSAMPLRDIWFGAKYQKVRENLIFERFEDQRYCAECDNWSSSYQYQQQLQDGTNFIFGESMGYYYFPKKNR